MATELQNELKSFRRFIEQQLRHADCKLSPEQALAIWRERVDTIESVRRGLDDVEAGRTRPADEVVADLREELKSA